MAKATRSVNKGLVGETIGRNVSVQVEDGILIVRADVNAEGKESKSGKSSVVGTTNGNVAVPGTDLKLGFNLYRPE